MSRMFTRSRRPLFAAAVLTLGWGLNHASAGLPDLPPFVAPPPRGVADQPPIVIPPPVVDEPPPIHSPPVQRAPEPATLVLGLLGAGVAGMVARRRKCAG